MKISSGLRRQRYTYSIPYTVKSMLQYSTKHVYVCTCMYTVFVQYFIPRFKQETIILF